MILYNTSVCVYMYIYLIIIIIIILKSVNRKTVCEKFYKKIINIFIT